MSRSHWASFPKGACYLGLLAFIALASASRAAEETKGGRFQWAAVPSKSARSVRDFLMATRARAALWRDKELAHLSLNVSVRNGEASLFGPVPDDRTRQHAVSVVRQIEGIQGVHDYLRVRIATPPRFSATAPTERRETPGALTKFPKFKSSEDGDFNEWRPHVDAAPSSVGGPPPGTASPRPTYTAGQWQPSDMKRTDTQIPRPITPTQDFSVVNAGAEEAQSSRPRVQLLPPR